MQDISYLDKPLPLNSFALHRNFMAVFFPDKLKRLRNGPFKIINKTTEVTYELYTQNGKLVYT